MSIFVINTSDSNKKCQYSYERIREKMDYEQYNDRELYLRFKKSLNSVIKFSAKNNKNGVMLSGGVDSRLLMLIMYRMGHEVNTYTLKQFPFSQSNLKDVVVAKYITSTIGIKHRVVDIDYHKFILDELVEMVN